MFAWGGGRSQPTLFSDGEEGADWARLGAVSSTLVAFLMLMERSDSDRLTSTIREPPVKAIVGGTGASGGGGGGGGRRRARLAVDLSLERVR